MNKPISCIPIKQTEAWWLQRHAEKRHESVQHDNQYDLVIIGDSIVHSWELDGKQAWHTHFGHLKTLNLGFAGDRTEHVLWRIKNGELASLKAKYVIVLIGTNNAGHNFDPPEAIAQGIKEILNSIQDEITQCKIVLTAIFPRSRNPRKKMRKMVDETNQIIQHFADGDSIVWFDINRFFLDENGILDESVMPDLLHPNTRQYEIWASQLAKILPF